MYDEVTSRSVEEALIKSYNTDSSTPGAPSSVNVIPNEAIEDSDSVRPYEVPVCRSSSMLHANDTLGAQGRTRTPDNSYDEAPKRHSIPSTRRSRSGGSWSTSARSSCSKRTVRSETHDTHNVQL